MNIKFLFLFILVSSVSISCDTDDSDVKTYILENQSGVDIKLKLYTEMKRTDGSIQNVTYLDLPNGKSWKEMNYSKDYNFILFMEAIDTSRSFKDVFNTVEVIYDNKKRKKFVEEYQIESGDCRNVFGEKVICDDRNFLNASIYNGVNEHFIFTVEDFDNAEECNGSCD